MRSSSSLTSQAATSGFVLLWGSAAIFSRLGLDNASPLALLVVRFLPLVGGLLWSVCSIAALGTGIIALVSDRTQSETAAGLI